MSRSFRTYEQAIEFLFGRINYERVADAAYALGELKLDCIRHLLALLGDPQDRLKVVHVAGTKGKGSTSAMVAAMLSAAGHTTGLFTSPHVSAFEERMMVDGVAPTHEHVVDLVNRLVASVDAMDHLPGRMAPTYFELATAMAWLYFLDCGAERAVLEVGLGGRLDATNVCRPLATVITNISRDHTNVLGSSPAEIAREKAGIVKPGVPLISGVETGPAADVVEGVCRRAGSPLFRLGGEISWRIRPAEFRGDVDNASVGKASVMNASAAVAAMTIDVDTPWGTWTQVPVPLRGQHQGANAAIAVATIGLLAGGETPIPEHAVREGMTAVRWPARIEVVGLWPTVIVDVAHNWASAQALIQTLDAEFSARRRILVLAATRDKDVAGIVRLLLPRFDSVIVTQYQNNPRCVPVQELAAFVQAHSRNSVHAASDAGAAWRLARRIAAGDDLICITGSFFIAAELREMILDGRGSDAIESPPATDGVTTPILHD